MTIDEALKLRDNALYQAKTERMRNNLLQQRWLKAVAERDDLRRIIQEREEVTR